MRILLLILLVVLSGGCQTGEVKSDRGPASSKVDKHYADPDDLSVSTLQGLTVQRLTPFKSSELNVEFYGMGTDPQKPFFTKKYNLGDFKDLADLVAECKKILQSYDEQKAKDDSEDESGASYDTVSFSSKGRRMALAEIARLAEILSQSGIGEKTTMYARTHIIELTTALRNNFRYPTDTSLSVPKAVSEYAIPSEVVKEAGKNPAQNVEPGQSDPVESTFWKKPKNISQKDLYYGFDRESMTDISEKICEYTGPKAQWGVHPGMHIRCGKKDYKLKFGNETHPGIFNSRIYWALGYNVPILDFALAPKVKYNRDIFLEFNQRKDFGFRILGHQIMEQKYNDPFDFVVKAVLTDGSSISSGELKKRILKDTTPAAKKGYAYEAAHAPEAHEDNYNSQFENQVDYLVFKEGSLFVKDKSMTIGPFDYTTSDHSDRRELRGMYLIAAWVNEFDMHWLNTKVVMSPTEEGHWQLSHTFSDVGAGFSKSKVEDFPWTMTAEREGQVYLHVKTQESGNRAYDRMDTDDAQWMLRMMAQITEAQLTQALVASGFPAAEARLALEKLVSIRNEMIRNFGMEKELAFALRKEDRRLNFYAGQTPMTATLPDQTTVAARPSGEAVVNGHLKNSAKAAGL